jgi:hypothetical protein
LTNFSTSSSVGASARSGAAKEPTRVVWVTPSLRAQPGGHAAGIALRVDQAVLAGRDQQRRDAGAAVIHRLRGGRRGGIGKDQFRGRIFDREEIVGTGQSDPAGQARRRHRVFVQPAGVECHHRGVVAAGAVAHHEQARRVAAVSADVLGGPRHRLGRVVEECRVFHFRIEPVVGDHHHHPARRQRAADEGIVGTLAVAPVAAIEEHHHRRGAGSLVRAVDVELEAGTGAKGDAGRCIGCAGGRERVERRQRRAGGQAAKRGKCGKCGGQAVQGQAKLAHYVPVSACFVQDNYSHSTKTASTLELALTRP